MAILFRCDGGQGKRIGTGHVYRCLDLASRLEEEGIESKFLMSDLRNYEPGVKLVESRGFPVERLPMFEMSVEKEAASILESASRADNPLVVLNHYPVQKGLAEKLRGKVKTLAFSFFNDVEVNADYVLNWFVSIPEDAKNNFGSRVYSGPTYYPGNNSLTFLHAIDKPQNAIRRIFVTCGGEDRHGLAIRTMETLHEIEEPFKATIVLGPASSYDEGQRMRLEGCKEDTRLDIVPSLPREEMLKKMHEADFAISAAGDTAYELACVGTPALYVCQAPHQLRTAEAFEHRRAGLTIGYGPKISDLKIQKAIRNLFHNPGNLKQMSQNGRNLVDGRGTERIVNEIVKIMGENKK